MDFVALLKETLEKLRLVSFLGQLGVEPSEDEGEIDVTLTGWHLLPSQLLNEIGFLGAPTLNRVLLHLIESLVVDAILIEKQCKIP